MSKRKSTPVIESAVIVCICGTRNTLKPDGKRQKCQGCAVTLWLDSLAAGYYIPYADLPKGVKSVHDLRGPVVNDKPVIAEWNWQ